MNKLHGVSGGCSEEDPGVSDENALVYAEALCKRRGPLVRLVDNIKWLIESRSFRMRAERSCT